MMKKAPAIFLVSSIVILLPILSLDTTYDQLNAEYLFKAPSVSTLTTQEYTQSILQNSEKDIVFIENLGQITDTEGEKRPDILFLTRSQGVDMYMTNSGLSYVFRDAESSYYRLDMEFIGMNKNINIKKELAVDQQYHYYTPEYPDGISPRAYKKLTMENIYEGIDLVYYEKEGRMKYDFLLKAGADAREIKMKYTGAASMNIDNNGNVIITTPMGEIMEEKPYTYSRTTGSEIESRYRVKNNAVLFDIAEYDDSEEIIIDPVRLWATYYGGSGDEGAGVWLGEDICTDNSGNLYVTGRTTSTNFPTQTLTGAYNQSTLSGGYDAFILKFYEFFAAFTISDDTICEGDSVSFSDQSLGNIIAWNWTFEGGSPSTSTIQHPTVTYNNQGDYDVQLIVSDGTNSDTLLIEDYISVLLTPTAMLLPFEDVCLTYPPFELTGGSPTGGIYSGPGVSNGWFDPADAGLGTHTITYTFTGLNGCDNFDEETILVDPCTVLEELEAGTISIYPNPFNTAARIEYQLEQPGKVVVTIYNHLGQQIETLISEHQSKGEYSVIWEAQELPQGIYFYRLQAGNQQATGKMVKFY